MNTEKNFNNASHADVFGHLKDEVFNRDDALLYLDVNEKTLAFLLLKTGLAVDQTTIDVGTLRKMKAIKKKINIQD
jgi:hypothetical protein